MKTLLIKLMKFSFPKIILLLFCSINMYSQPVVSAYSELGSTNVSQGMYIRSATSGEFSFGKNKAETGIQFDLKDSYKNGVSGYFIRGSRKFALEGIPFDLEGFFIQTTPSDIVRKTDWGALLSLKHNRFEMALGTNFRTYTLRQKASGEYEIDNSHSRIHEIYNVMYSFSYYLKATDENWNVGLQVTNIDHFNINQETNPLLNLRGTYKISSPVSLFLQVCYKCAGVTNLELNHFGYFFRTGIIWNIN